MRTLVIWSFYIFIDLVVACLATLLNDQQPSLPFLATLAILWIGLPLAGLLWILKFWLAYWLFLRTRMVRFYKAEMYKFKFPSTNGHFAWNQYLEYVMTEASAKKEAAVKAGVFVGEIEGFRTTRPFTMFIAAQSSFEQAMSEYQAPPSTSGLFESARHVE
ncbi:hypothetical protein CO663_33870 [Rhizobium anhuiense]|uniref:hypothetical protein n=1 Tax=Rhizobium anhuiense TaxID=1184720 RepID=UPI000BEAC87C|nr:hypothetical protein [Rhizobium anhuiense]PDS54678.1 hypothetical protein CO663_33870 [Rhizobium anhuiense]